MPKSPSPYAQLLQRGPFPGRIDPFAEMSKYFHQIHDNLIGSIAGQIGGEILDLGYVLSQENSIQIGEVERKPDIAFHTTGETPTQPPRLDYEQAAIAALTEPGILAVSEEDQQNALHIREMGTHHLVTVIEVISPSNKAGVVEITTYRAQRQELFLAQGVNVVEIDLTRSYQRLFKHRLTEQFPYHTAILLPDEFRIVGHEVNQPLKRFAVPLRQEVVAIDLQSAYDDAYLRSMVAPQLLNENLYIEAELPFPSLLTTEQRDTIMRAVEAWQAELKQLRGD